MWIEKGFSPEVVDRYAEELFYIDWLYTHHSFQEGFVHLHEDTIRYFLEKDYPEEFLAEYFSHEWNMGNNEIEAIINQSKHKWSNPPYKNYRNRRSNHRRNSRRKRDARSAPR